MKPPIEFRPRAAKSRDEPHDDAAFARKAAKRLLEFRQKRAEYMRKYRLKKKVKP